MSESSDLPEEGHNPFRAFTRESLENGRTAEESKNKKEEKEVEREVLYKNKIENEAPDPILEEGMRLPYRLRKVVTEGLVNTPVEDIDPFYKDQSTFVMINNRRDIYRFNAKSTFWLFDPFSSLRRGALYISIHPLFSIFVMLTIFVNAIFLTIPHYPTLIKSADAIFLIVYTFEMIIKILAKGFILHPFAYLRDSWNWIDFIVTLFSYIDLTSGLMELHFVQSIRMVRLIKLDIVFPGFRPFVRAIFTSDKKLRPTYTFALGVLSIVAIWFSQNYMGVLTQKCIRQFPEDGSWGNLTDKNWEQFNSNYSNIDLYSQCGNSSGAGQCAPGFVCLQGYGINPNYGYTNFDTFSWSLLSAFRLMTQDYWENLYQMVLKSAGPWHILFFIMVIFLVSFNFLNLILAVVTMAFNEIKQQAEDDEKAEESSKSNKLSSESKDTTLDIEDVTEKTSHFSSNHENERTICTKITDYLCIWNCCRCWTTLQQFVASIVLNPIAELLFLLNILVNTIFMALDHHDMSISLERLLSTGNYMCVLIFAVEVISKIIAMSPKYYFQKSWNKLDFVIFMVCILELMIEGVYGLSILRALRPLRLIRMIKIIRLSGSSRSVLNYLISVVEESLGPFNKLTILFFVVTNVFGLIGMHLLGINYIDNVDRFPEGELPRWSFIDLLHSFMLIFRASCGEWIESMWDCMLVGDITAIPFFITVVMTGGFVMKNLFLSIILHSFELCDHSTPDEDEDTKKMMDAIDKLGLSKFKKNNTTSDAAERSSQMRDETDPTSLRLKISKLINSKYFKTVIITIIFVSSLAVTLEDIHLSQRPSLENILYYMDIVFMLFFIAEMLLMCLGLGFKKYFTSTWYLLDFIVVVVLVINFVCSVSGCGAIQIFKTMRILRLFTVLRICSNCDSMKIVLSTLVKAIPDTFGALILCFLAWLVFAIVGVQLFAGKYYKCVDDDGTVLSYEIVPDRSACVDYNYTWARSEMNFDHIGNAYLSLVQVATFKGWIQIMNDAIDSRQIDKQPIREANIYMYLYFVVFIIYGVFLIFNLFIGLIVRSYNREKKSLFGEKSAKYYNAIKRIESKKPKKSIPKPNWKLQSVLYEIVTHKYFEVVMMVIIALNVLVMAIDHYNCSVEIIEVLAYSNFIFILIFIVECLLKIVALRHHYLLDSWNWFDFTLVLQQIFALVASDILFKYFYFAPLHLMRVIRILKIRKNLRLVKCLKSIRILFFAIANSLRALFSVAALLFLIMSIYAVFGMLFFKNVKEGNALDDVFNFKTFGQSMILLFQYITLAGWDGALLSLMNEEDCTLPNSEIGEPGNCGNFTIAVIYLLSYIFISFMIINVYIAVILANYFEATEDEEEGLTDDDVNMFYEVWQKFDPYATEYIRLDQLTDFLEALEPPFQFGKYSQDRIERLDIPSNKDNQVYYKDVLKALTESFFSKEHSELA